MAPSALAAATGPVAVRVEAGAHAHVTTRAAADAKRTTNDVRTANSTVDHRQKESTGCTSGRPWRQAR